MTSAYAYDNLNRLLSVDYTGTGTIFTGITHPSIDYTYDALGNILSASHLGSYSYTGTGRENPHAVTAIESPSEATSYGYDTNGNINTQSQTIGTGATTNSSYTYNPKNNLKETQFGTGATTYYTYNASNIRTSKITDDVINRYINKEYEVNIEGTGTGQTIETNKYIFLGTTKLATVKKQNSNPEEITYHTDDHLGSSNIDLDTNGSIVGLTHYYPFGETRYSYLASNHINKYLYIGKERDSETNLDYFEARYYNNQVGRFRSIDPVFWEAGQSQRFEIIKYDPQQFNAYTYARNNSIINSDSTGEICDSDVANSYFCKGIKSLGWEEVAPKVVTDLTEEVLQDVSPVPGTEVGIEKSIPIQVTGVAIAIIIPGPGAGEVKAGEKISKAVKDFWGVASDYISKNKNRIYDFKGTRKEFDDFYEKLKGAKKGDKDYLDLREKSKGDSSTNQYDGPPTIDLNIDGKDYKIKFKGDKDEK